MAGHWGDRRRDRDQNPTSGRGGRPVAGRPWVSAIGAAGWEQLAALKEELATIKQEYAAILAARLASIEHD